MCGSVEPPGAALVISGCYRSGTTLMLMLLAGTVSSHSVYTEREAVVPEEICKNPWASVERPLRRPILMVRDPREIVSSMLSLKGGYFVTGAMVLEAFDAMARYPASSHFRYADLVSNPDKMQERVGEYWELEFSRKFSDFPHADVDYLSSATIMNGVRPIDRGHDWREHRERIEEQFDAAPRLYDVLNAWGFADAGS